MRFFWQNPVLSMNPVDPDAAHELELYLENDTRFAPFSPEGMGRNVAKNMARKIDKGQYDTEKAVKGWMYVVDAAAKQYAKEFGGTWHQMFDKPTRMLVARRMAEDFYRLYLEGEFRP